MKGDKIGLKKKNDDICKDMVDENVEDKQLPDERYINRNYIKESECSSIANTQEEALKIGNKNKYDDDDESLVNLNKYYDEDDKNISTQKSNSIFDGFSKFNETIENNDNNNKNIDINNTIQHNPIPPTPPPPLDDKFLKTINNREKVLDISSTSQPSLHEQNIQSHSPTLLYTNIDNDKRFNETDIEDSTPTRNIIIIDSNKNDKLDENNFIFNNVVSKTHNTIPSSLSINPVSPDFFIGNSVFNPIADMEIYKKEFNRKTKDKWCETTISPNVPNNSRNIREGTTFDVNIHGNELKNKNYYVTCPSSDRNTPTFNTNNSFTELKNNFESMNGPINYDNTMSQKNYNIGCINENPTLLSCKRTFERRVVSRSYNQDNQGHYKKNWEVETYQTMKNEMPASYNFYTRSAYK